MSISIVIDLEFPVLIFAFVHVVLGTTICYVARSQISKYVQSISTGIEPKHAQYGLAEHLHA